MSTKKQIEVRQKYIDRLRMDLLGPRNTHEKIEPDEYGFVENPRNIYLSGALYPMDTEPGKDEMQEIIEEAGNDSIGSANDAPIINTKLPSSIGLSFFIQSNTQNSFEINAVIEGGIYNYIQNEEPDGASYWQRNAIGIEKKIEIDCGSLPNDRELIPLESKGLKGFEIYLRWSAIENVNSESIHGALLKVTLVLVNRNKYDRESDDFHILTEKTLFQSKLRLSTVHPAEFAANPKDFGNFSKNQQALNRLLYRNSKEYAKGHTCSAEWDLNNGTCSQIFTEWVPEEIVYDTNIDGNKEILNALRNHDLDGFNASTLSTIDKNEMQQILSVIPESYDNWLRKEENNLGLLDSEEYKSTAKDQIKFSKISIERIKSAIKLLSTDEKFFKAFQFANEAINLQYGWANNGNSLTWRPFQLGFILLSIESVLKGESKERNVMDLLWFPTGGGKTEAYLFLIACLLFYRRLEKGDLDSDDGVCVITRYTLRALTSDQFKRTSGLICACEYVRRKNITTNHSSPFSIGLWIGQSATPNRLSGSKDAAIYGGKGRPKQLSSKVKQLTDCPCCKTELKWDFEKNYSDPDQLDPVFCSCTNGECDLAVTLERLPIHTVDDQIYNVSPSVVIGTVDKFVNITGRPDRTKSLFNLDSENKPPDLIIQDELHLISGPLGSLTGIFETVIDTRCSTEDKEGKMILPKLIGSTATIQQAEEQIKSLYNRPSFTFPIPVSEAGETFFSEIDRESSGRRYIGLSSAGRTSTYIYSVAAGSLMQSRNDSHIASLGDLAIDPYTTLAVYFNSLRELGGARTHLQEDAAKAREVFASKYGEYTKAFYELTELTSNVTQEELTLNLENLTKSEKEDGHIDILLASSMISVGIDIPRLGLMMVNGQPKTMSEYIQATSRVGRGKIPGLVLTVYNAFKVRDRSYYESFKTWHSSFYRHVEATSVTPFSARARDKILPSLVVALSYQFLKDLTESDVELTSERRNIIEARVIPVILDRVRDIDPDECESTEIEIIDFLDKWQSRGSIEYLWNDYKGIGKTLLISANRSSMIRARGYDGEIAATSAPTSARDVEPTVEINLWDGGK